MCGIIGVTGSEKEGIQKASSIIRHRGPDAQGFMDDGIVTLGHNRLSIIDLDVRSNQPLWNAERNICVVYNGEIYNFKKLRRELEAHYTFTTNSDTEVILAGHTVWGNAFPEKARGMFAYALYDSRRRTVTLVRDHAGIKPLYYFCDGLTFAFASEVSALRALLRERNVPLVVDAASIRSYWVFGYVPSPRTVWEGIRVVPRSHILTYDCTSRKLTCSEYEPYVEVADSERDLYTCIEESVMSHVVADVPVGLFFSGGIDSTLIASILKKRKHPLKAYSVRVTGRTGDESYFKTISAALNLDAQIVEFDPDAFEHTYDHVMTHMDVPLADHAIFPTAYISQHAAREVKVVLTGEGGDELFFGYPRQQVMARMSAVYRTFSNLDTFVCSLPQFRGKSKAASHFFQLIKDAPSYYLNEISSLRGFHSAVMVREAKAELQVSTTNGLLFDREFYLENMLLRKLDLATMMYSIEGRVPLLDQSVVTYARMHEQTFGRGDVLKPVLKRMLLRELPYELVHRPKSGFGLRPADYFRHSRRFNEDLAAAAPFLNDQTIEIPSLPDPATLIERYPDAAYALVALYRSLSKNL